VSVPVTYTYLLVAALADQPVPLLGEFPDGVVDRRRDGRAVQQLAVVSELGQLRTVSEELPTERLQTRRRTVAHYCAQLHSLYRYHVSLLTVQLSQTFSVAWICRKIWTGQGQSGQAVKLFRITPDVNDFETLNNPGYWQTVGNLKN